LLRHKGYQFQVINHTNALFLYTLPFPVGDDLDAVLVPGDHCIVLVDRDLKLALVVLYTILRIELRRELVLRV
jgi:hypothetical protein